MFKLNIIPNSSKQQSTIKKLLHIYCSRKLKEKIFYISFFKNKSILEKRAKGFCERENFESEFTSNKDIVLINNMNIC